MNIENTIKQNPITTGVVVLLAGFAISRLIKAKPFIPSVPPIPEVPSGDSKGYNYVAQQYSDFADQIASALSGAGSDENLVYNIFKKMKNRSDILALINAYGRRSIATPYGWDTDPMTLSETLYYDLDQKEIIAINNIIKKTNYAF